ncbi:MAG TPA: 3-dehydroquinate synthase [Kiritimatiellia bacterium]|nr:3-dehydroquinate synthase [Kiritimatiellia bacterium]HPS07161.1 3-dehydroquinate synthase [Kiritimatiellia bacterium]
MHLFLYGPPGSGKSTIGHILARRLDLPFVDLDAVIADTAKQKIPDIFACEGEAGFRARETAALKAVIACPPAVIGLGGGALLKTENRALAEAAGVILCLEADLATLQARVNRAPGTRPLLSSPHTDCMQPPKAGQKSISQLLAERAEHYASFSRRVMVSDRPPEETADAAQAALGLFRISGMGPAYDVRVGDGVIDTLGARFRELGCGDRTVIVGDTHTLPLYGERAAAALRAHGVAVSLVAIPAGEETKTIATVAALWSAFLKAGIERGHAVIALGGGVTGDLTGFAAATWLRGVRWVGLPTTLLAMVDSGLGGKTGADLPEGKNLIGAFHPPALVLADTSVLATLPLRELRCGLAEAVKHAVIGDPALLDELPRFAFCKSGEAGEPGTPLANCEWLAAFVARAMAVKIRVIQQDPFEKGFRAALNLGHTIGHGIEKATHFTVQHGEAVAIGTVLEARLAEALGLAKPGLAAQLTATFSDLGLPVEMPDGINLAEVQTAMALDKKKAGGKVRFALPAAIGDVRVGVDVKDALLRSVLSHAPCGC